MFASQADGTGATPVGSTILMTQADFLDWDDLRQKFESAGYRLPEGWTPQFRPADSVAVDTEEDLWHVRACFARAAAVTLSRLVAQ